MSQTQNGALITSLEVNGTAVAAGNPLPVSIPTPVTTAPTPAATSVVTRVAANIANVTLKAANAARLGLTIQNNATSNLYVKLGATANIGSGTESFTVRLVPNAYYEVPFGWVGIVDGIWDAVDATGEALITELTA